MSWPFSNWQRVAIRSFGLSPEAFWAMPVREWLMLISNATRTGLDRAGLRDLMIDFPDEGGPDGPNT